MRREKDERAILNILEAARSEIREAGGYGPRMIGLDGTDGYIVRMPPPSEMDPSVAAKQIGFNVYSSDVYILAVETWYTPYDAGDEATANPSAHADRCEAIMAFVLDGREYTAYIDRFHRERFHDDREPEIVFDGNPQRIVPVDEDDPLWAPKLVLDRMREGAIEGRCDAVAQWN